MTGPSRSLGVQGRAPLLMKLLLCPGLSQTPSIPTDDILFSFPRRVYLSVLSGGPAQGQVSGQPGEEISSAQPEVLVQLLVARVTCQQGHHRPRVPRPPSWGAVTCGRAGMEARPHPNSPTQSCAGVRARGAARSALWQGPGEAQGGVKGRPETRAQPGRVRALVWGSARTSAESTLQRRAKWGGAASGGTLLAPAPPGKLRLRIAPTRPRPATRRHKKATKARRAEPGGAAQPCPRPRAQGSRPLVRAGAAAAASQGVGNGKGPTGAAPGSRRRARRQW